METPENVQFVKLCLIPVSILGYSLQIQCIHFLGYSLIRKVLPKSRTNSFDPWRQHAVGVFACGDVTVVFIR